MRFLPLLLAASALAPLPASADDSSATVSAGGLVLEKTDKVALVSEDLYLSAQAVRIAYRFRNRTSQDVATTIAFPMPDLTGQPEGDIAIPDPEQDNFLHFATIVDGRPVDSKVEQRAFLTADGQPDVEITDKLLSLHIPLLPTAEATEKAIARLSDAQRKALEAAKIVQPEDDDAGKGAQVAEIPLWTLRSKFWRQQVFPAGKDVVVQQSYVPGVGSLAALSYGSPDQDPQEKAAYAKNFCTDDAFAKAAQALYKKANAETGHVTAYEQYLSYVITSGGNWAGPIGSFRLVVDKGDPQSLISFCGQGVKKTGPTTFEMLAKDYVPTRDIDVLFLRVSTRN